MGMYLVMHANDKFKNYKFSKLIVVIDHKKM